MLSAFGTSVLVLSLFVAVFAEVAALAGKEEDAGPIPLALSADVVVDYDRLSLLPLLEGAHLWRSTFNLILIINIGKLCIVRCKSQNAESFSDQRDARGGD